MKCLNCGMEMEQGTVEAIGQGGGHWYEFTSDEEKKKTGLKGFFTKETISVETSALESPAWHCPKCKKILIWIDSKE
nr:PF20097 family protein [uncultured Anaerostipes sp.]